MLESKSKQIIVYWALEEHGMETNYAPNLRFMAFPGRIVIAEAFQSLGLGTCDNAQGDYRAFGSHSDNLFLQIDV